MKISSFDSIEGFANLYRELKPVAELADGSHYFVFREKEAPVWEEHTSGCLYTFYLISADAAEHNKLWEKVLITLLSEQFFNENIIGAEVGFKKEDKKSVISIWTKTMGRKQDTKKRIAYQFLSFFPSFLPSFFFLLFKNISLPPFTVLYWTSHTHHFHPFHSSSGLLTQTLPFII